jgi:hypothetical protein
MSAAYMPVIGSIGTAINAYQDYKGSKAANQFQTEQVRRAIAAADATRAEQIAFDQNERAGRIAFNDTTRADQAAFDERTRGERIAYNQGSLAEQIARERQNLEATKADQDTNLARIMASMQENIAARQSASDRAFAASGREVGRQQEYGRAQGDAFASSLGEFGGGFNQDMAAKSDSLAAIFADMLGRQGPASNAPAASAPTASFEADARAQASGMVGSQADKLAALQAFGSVMNDKNIAMGRNQQLDAIIQNFARGSQSALGPEVDAASMFFESNPILTKTPTASLAAKPEFMGERFVAPNFVGSNFVAPRFVQQEFAKPAPSVLGDLFVGLANAGVQYANQPAPTPSPYALSLPSGTGQSGLRLGSGTGINTARPARLGIR